jgi:alkylation response protein AidB-like acyl-CoA dehydrogenase
MLASRSLMVGGMCAGIGVSNWQSYGVTETVAGSDVAGIKTTAVRKGDEVHAAGIWHDWPVTAALP